jgi:hypothetical protein
MTTKSFDLPAEVAQAAASVPEVHPLLAEVQADRSAQQAAKGQPVQDNSGKPVITVISPNSEKQTDPDGGSQTMSWDPKTNAVFVESTGPQPEENYKLWQWPDRSKKEEFADGTGYTATHGAGANDGISIHHWGPKPVDNYEGKKWTDGTLEVSDADGTGFVQHISSPGPGYTLHHWGPKAEDNYDYATSDKQETIKYANGTGEQILTDCSGSTQVHSWGPNPQDNYTKTFPAAGNLLPP